MCFRPAEVSMKKCTVCGAANKPVATVCEQCGAALAAVKGDFDADQAKLDAAIRPAPAKPSAPAAPGAPKPPVSSQPPRPSSGSMS